MSTNLACPRLLEALEELVDLSTELAAINNGPGPRRVSPMVFGLLYQLGEQLRADVANDIARDVDPVFAIAGYLKDREDLTERAALAANDIRTASRVGLREA